MRIWVLAVGRPGRLLSSAIADYESRAARYWRTEVIEVRAERGGRSRSDEEVRAAESARLLERCPADARIIALTRDGEPWTSLRLAEYLTELTLAGSVGTAFLIGGAHGLSDATLRTAELRLSLSVMTLPHDLARLVLAEQLYRAGTIRQGEPYHKGGP